MVPTQIRFNFTHELHAFKDQDSDMQVLQIRILQQAYHDETRQKMQGSVPSSSEQVG